MGRWVLAVVIVTFSGCMGQNVPAPDALAPPIVPFTPILNETFEGAFVGGAAVGSISFSDCGGEPPCRGRFELPVPGVATKANLSLEWSSVDPSYRQLNLAFGPLAADAWRFEGPPELVSGESPLHLETVGPYPEHAVIGFEVTDANPLVRARLKQPFALAVLLAYEPTRRGEPFSLNLTEETPFTVLEESTNRTVVSFEFRGETEANDNPLDGSFWGCAITPAYAAGEPGCKPSFRFASPWAIEAARVEITWTPAASTNGPLEARFAPLGHEEGRFGAREDTVVASGVSPLVLEVAEMARAPSVIFSVRHAQDSAEPLPMAPPHPEQPLVATFTMTFVPR